MMTKHAQEIFESMNHTDRPLSPGEVSHNLLLINQTKELQQQIHTDYPKPLEEKLRRSNADEEIA